MNPVADDAVGVLDYSFGNYKLYVDESPRIFSGRLSPEVTDLDGSGGTSLTVGTYNVENLDPSYPASKFTALAEGIVDNLAAPDVLTLEEVQDNTGSTDDGTVAANETLDQLVAAIASAGGPAYDWRQINPQDKSDGGEPGGNIRVAFLFRTDRGLRFVDRGDGDATAGTDVVGNGSTTRLSLSPGRVAPTSSAWTQSRKPLAGEFSWQGRSVFVVANHFASKGGDDPLFGRFQPPRRSSEEQRHQQAQLLRGFVDDLLGADPQARVVVAGDINDFEFSETADLLVGSGATTLTDLPRTLPQPERYTYVFDGNSQVLDHILVARATTRVDGTYSVQVMPQENTIYRARYAGGNDNASRSESVSVAVAPVVKAFPSDDDIKRKDTLQVAGVVAPPDAVETARLEAKTTAGWRVLASGSVGTDGEYALRWLPSNADQGRYVMWVATTANDRFTAGSSPTFRVRVR
ncbi:MAG: endonuclease/exonuclease/phosphatase family protein [Actinomycetota bacterium]|nr:endonuclease/exonuclease/phosphatase family protein [Actinomycetota bacterium]